MSSVNRVSPDPSLAVITSVEGLPPALAASVSPEEAAYIETLRAGGGLPFAVSPRFASLAGPEQDDPIRRQFMPDPRESLASPFSLEDPLGEALYQKTPRLVHQYRDRALLRAGGACAGYCRFCFRRARIRNPAPFINTAAEEECAYLKGHPEIREVLVSGGDPLTAGDGELDALFASLRRARPGVLLRLCTRIPVTAPLRLGRETAAFLARWKPLRLAVHINHPRELEGPAGATLAACAGLGLPVLVQAVLLRGVNDRAETLAALFRECLSLGLTPYYLFQLDPAPGTDHFRVPLKEGLDLYEALKALLPGPGLPAYALDLPGGGGKIRLRKGVIAGETRGPGGAPAYLLPGPGGRLWPYPAE